MLPAWPRHRELNECEERHLLSMLTQPVLRNRDAAARSGGAEDSDRVELPGLSPGSPRDSPSKTPDRASVAILGLGTQRIIPATALVAHLRKRINAQRLGLSTCKAGALPTEL